MIQRENMYAFIIIHSESQKGEPGSKGNVGPTGAEGIKG